MTNALSLGWTGDIPFLLRNLLLKDFRVRYRNMSLGLGWSVANPLIMMSVLTFVFTSLLGQGSARDFPVFVLCGMVPFSFFTLSWTNGTTSLVDNAHLIKRTMFPRELIPISSVLGNAVHLGIQLALLIGITLLFGFRPTAAWIWLPYIILFEIVFVCGLALMFSALDVYVRDMRYVVESANTVLFWLVPVVYRFEIIPERFHWLYRFNPVAAVVMAFRNILMEGRMPASTLLFNLTCVSLFVLVLGLVVFRSLKRRFYDYL